MGFLIIPLSLLAGWLLSYPEAVIVAGTIWACIVRFTWETIQDWLEATL